MAENVYIDRILDCYNSSYCHSNICWHPAFPLLAVASNSTQNGGSYVSFYNERGVLQCKTNIPGEGTATNINQICWHPQRKLLIAACEQGDVYCWNEKDKIFIVTSPAQHTTNVTITQWSPCGSRLITADRGGVLVAWRLDNAKGQLDVIFRHDLDDCLTSMIFKNAGSISHVDIGGLAKAAVSGDEQALDFFNSYRINKNQNASSMNEINFYIGSESGQLYFVNNSGSCIEVAPHSFPIRYLMYYPTKNVVVVINESPTIIYYISNSDGTLEEISRLKLAGIKFEMNAVWVGSGVLALTIGESAIRIIDLDNGYNYSLLLEDGDHSDEEHFTCLSYLENNAILAAGTNLGNVQMWSNTEQSKDKIDSENQWKRIARCSLKGAVKHITWNAYTEAMAVNLTNNVSLVTSMEKCYCSHKQMFAVQMASNCLTIESLEHKKQLQLQSDFEIRGMFLTSESVAIWSGQKLAIYEINVETKKSRQIACFPTETTAVVIHEQSVYIVEGAKIQVRTYQGTVKQTLGFLENEGEVVAIDVCGVYLAAATNLGFVKLWELSRREARPFTNTKALSEYVNSCGSIVTTRVNCTGNKVIFVFSKDNKLLLWDIEADTLINHDFIKDFDMDDLQNGADTLLTVNPKSIYWDPSESRILSCEIVTQAKENEKKVSIISMFITTEHGILTQDVISVESSLYSHLVGVQVPNFYLLKKDTTSFNKRVPSASTTNKPPTLFHSITMKDFVGLDEKDSATKDAIMNFSFNLLVGNMDNAFKAIKKIKSAKIWENMARMCVKTKRLDVASVCLGHMGDATTAKALRKAESNLEPDARVALLATHLGMIDDAEKLYKSCERFDLLNKFYQASGQWEKALDVAVTSDRIHLKSTYYNYAKYLEAKGDVSTAISNYEKSQTHHFEVPRMLLEDPLSLEHYISKSQDKKLFKWWAQYLESSGEMETALQYYEKAKDSLSLVRVYCYCNNLEKAAEIADSTGDSADCAACYHLGRQYENNGKIKEAVHFFTKAHAYNNAIRICKEQCLEDQLLNLALMGGKNEMIDVARYYESKKIYIDRAVMLYHKGGLVGKAVELAFKSDQRGALEQLAYEMDEKSDPQVLHRCAAFFVEIGQPDKAVDLLVKAKDYLEAIALCFDRNVTMTEQLVEKLSPPKDLPDVKLRNELLEKLAECCYQQDNYHLATKKFTQAGNKIKAMKALLKSGDTERIVFFANVSRQPEIYIMAANYMQTLDWRKHPEIMKNIINFYTKGKALDLLAGFFEACAEVEIDEFQNYEKALGALHEAYKNLSSVNEKNRNSKESDKMDRLRVKIEIIKKFVNIRTVYEENATESMRLCQAFFKEENLNLGVRPGDVYGFMIEHYAREKNYKQAYGLIGEMKTRLPNANLAFYIDPSTIATIYRGMDIPYPNGSSMIIENDIKRNGHIDESEQDDVKEEFY